MSLSAAQAAEPIGTQQAAERSLVEASGPVRLSPAAPRSEAPEASTPSPLIGAALDQPLSEFEQFVSAQAGSPVRRLGAELLAPDSRSPLADGQRQIPADYLIGVGDEIHITLWGSVDADLRVVVDRSGRISLPRVGSVLVAGVRYSDLNDTVQRRVAQVFRNFQLSTALGKLRGIRVYVTGFTQKPGAYTVSSLSTVVSGLLQAGGPSASGSFRKIELRRGGKAVARLDLYDLLVKGDKSGDLALQAEDVIHIHPVGPQVGVLGSVNRSAVVELVDGETLADALSMAGGFNTVADRSRVAIERLADRNEQRINQLAMPAENRTTLTHGDIVRVFSAVSAFLPQHRQHKRVLVQGEVRHPGEYILPPTSSLADAIAAAGGLTPQAYIFGAEFTRESVRKAQQENYERALRDLELEFTKSTSTLKALSADEANSQAARANNSSRLIERLRAVKPTGRLVLQLDATARELPALAVEDGDRLNIPARPNTVGVFGSVFNGGSYLINAGSTVNDMLKLAGGPTRGADTGSVFVLRANGSVVSARQSGSGWFGVGSNLNVPALPGDTIFVPEELNKTTFAQEAKEWTQILYQFGLGAAALKTLKN
ncbi:SLBB domain-containing protein [Roseateles sp. BYS180W]|uniref:SLBB domain-containing protein n=1 Tax=Roseateles rivi TaxID=3299028 RepID=A0ABW7FSG1_9BURK